MKIREGFVSNSSSSSFVLGKPDKYLSISDVIDLYGITDKYGQDFQNWVAIKVWHSINHTSSCDASSYFDNILDPDQMNFRLQSGYWKNWTPEFYQKVQQNKDKWPEHVVFSVSSDFSDYYDEEFKIPYDVRSALDDRSEDIFTKTENAFGIYEH